MCLKVHSLTDGGKGFSLEMKDCLVFVKEPVIKLKVKLLKKNLKDNVNYSKWYKVEIIKEYIIIVYTCFSKTTFLDILAFFYSFLIGNHILYSTIKSSSIIKLGSFQLPTTAVLLK